LGSPVLCRFRHPGPASTMPFRACASLPPRGTGPRLACRGSVWAPSSGRNQREVDPVPSLHLRPGISRPRRLRVVAEAEAPGLPAALTAGMATTLHSFSPWVGVAINGARRVPRYLARRSAGGESPERPLISRATIRRASNCSSARKVIFARISDGQRSEGFRNGRYVQKPETEGHGIDSRGQPAGSPVLDAQRIRPAVLQGSGPISLHAGRREQVP